MPETRRVLSVEMRGRDRLSPVTRLTIRGLQRLERIGVAALRKLARAATLPLRALKALTNPVNLLRGALVGLGGAALLKVITSSIDAADAIDKMSKRTGIASDLLQELRFASELAGTNLDQMDVVIRRMQKTLLDASRELATPLDALERMNLTVEEFEGLDPAEQFFKMAGAMAALEDASERAALAQVVFGRSGTRILLLLDDGVDALREIREEARDAGLVLSQEAIDAFVQAKDDITRFQFQLRALRDTIVVELLPTFNELTLDLVGFLRENRQGVREFSRAVVANLRFAVLSGRSLIRTLLALIRDPRHTRELEAYLESLGSFALDVIKATAIAGLRTVGNVLQLASTPAILAAKVIGRKVGQEIREGILDPFRTTPLELVEELEAEIADLERQIVPFAAVPVQRRSRRLLTVLTQLETELSLKRNALARAQRELADQIEQEAAPFSRILAEELQKAAAAVKRDGLDLQETMAELGVGVREAAADFKASLTDALDVGAIIAAAPPVPLGFLLPLQQALQSPLARLIMDLERFADERDKALARGDSEEAENNVRSFAAALEELGDTAPEVESVLPLLERFAGVMQRVSDQQAQAQIGLLEGRPRALAEIALGVEQQVRAVLAFEDEAEAVLAEVAEKGLLTAQELSARRIELTESTAAAIVAIERQAELDRRELTGSFLEGFEQEARDTLDIVSNQFQNGRDAFADFFGTLEGGLADVFGAMVDGTRDAGQAWKDLGREILGVIAQVLARQAALAALRLFFPGAPGIAQGAVLQSGRILERFQAGGIIDRPVVFPVRGGLGLAGEAGPEAVLPLRRTTRGSLGVEVAGADQPQPVAVTFNVFANDTKGFDQLLSERQELIEDMVARAVISSRNVRETIQANT